MLMCVDVGNKVISIGFFDLDGDIRYSFSISSDISKTADEYLVTVCNIANTFGIERKAINGAIVSSVVPQLTHKIKKTIFAFSGTEPLIVGPGVKTGFPIKIDNPSELGADIVANTAAVVREKRANSYAIIVDVDHINTISAIGKNGEYLGCVIFPGAQASLEALSIDAALLPNVSLSPFGRVIGKTSQDAMCSGAVLGNAMVIDGFIDRFASEFNCGITSIELYATGEYAPFILKESKNSFKTDEHLTLKGLYFIYKSNSKN